MVSTVNNLKVVLNAQLGNPPHITAAHMPVLAPLIGRGAGLKIIDGILSADGLLDQTAGQSQLHPLGFARINVLDLSIALPDGNKRWGCQARLHVWPRGSNNGVPIVEGMHFHSFDFVSSVLLGEPENQCFRVSTLSQAEEIVCKKFQTRLSALSAQERDEANRQIEALEAIRLEGFGSRQAAREKMLFDRQLLRSLLQMTDADLEIVVGIQGRYEAEASSTEEGKYRHRLIEMVSLNPQTVLNLRSGDTYYHGHEIGHRLYIRSDQWTVTLIITTPVSQEALGGSFQRPTWISGDDVSYERQNYTAQELKSLLLEVRQELISAPPPAQPGRFLDASAGLYGGSTNR